MRVLPIFDRQILRLATQSMRLSPARRQGEEERIHDAQSTALIA
jgi:hypothetical protein